MRELVTGMPDLRGSVEDGVAVLVLDRPERRNALTTGMVDGLARVLAEAARAFVERRPARSSGR